MCLPKLSSLHTSCGPYWEKPSSLALGFPTSSFRPHQQCKALATLYKSYVSGLSLKPQWDEVTPPIRQKLGFLPLTVKVAGSSSSASLSCKAAHSCTSTHPGSCASIPCATLGHGAVANTFALTKKKNYLWPRSLMSSAFWEGSGKREKKLPC